MKDQNKWPFTIKMEEAARNHDSVTMRATAEFAPGVVMKPTLVAISEDPRESELLTLFRNKDARGKECLIRMARVMPCGECG